MKIGKGLILSGLLLSVFLGGCAGLNVPGTSGGTSPDEKPAAEATGETSAATEKVKEPVSEEALQSESEAASEAVTESVTEAADHPEPAPAAETEAVPEKNGFSVCIDPGHQGSWVDMSEVEPNAPGSSSYKAKATTGTQGQFSGVPEYELNLQIGLQLKEELENRGYRAVLTREDNDAAISNSERALMASEENCDIMVRIHANGSEDPSMHGALAMVMSPDNPWVGSLFEQSRSLADNIMAAYTEQTGFTNLGIQYYDDMTGINWSKVPVVILEMGFMSNESDDLAMEEPAMQQRMTNGIADGIDRYFGVTRESHGVSEDEDETGSEGDVSASAVPSPAYDHPVSDLYEMYFSGREQNGEKWAVSLDKLGADNAMQDVILEYNGDMVMQSASVIKIFIMGAVYERVCYPDGTYPAIVYDEQYEGELRSLLENMISVSDNDCANRLVEILGEGDFERGKEVVNQFCKDHGYTASHLGRRFLASNPTDDNYTSAADCRKILSEIYRGTLVNFEASEKMLSLLKMQTVRYKLPAGLPPEFTSASKTGEMPEGYGLGCIENDVAIIFSPYGDYVLAVLSNDLGGRNDEAQHLFHDISSYVASWISGGTAGPQQGEAGEVAVG